MIVIDTPIEQCIKNIFSRNDKTNFNYEPYLKILRECFIQYVAKMIKILGRENVFIVKWSDHLCEEVQSIINSLN